MKLQQGQIWDQGGQYFRIVHLERLVVDYKEITCLATHEGKHHRATKKEFCRLIKGARLVPAADGP